MSWQLRNLSSLLSCPYAIRRNQWPQKTLDCLTISCIGELCHIERHPFNGVRLYLRKFKTWNRARAERRRIALPLLSPRHSSSVANCIFSSVSEEERVGLKICVGRGLQRLGF